MKMYIVVGRCAYFWVVVKRGDTRFCACKLKYRPLVCTGLLFSYFGIRTLGASVQYSLSVQYVIDICVFQMMICLGEKQTLCCHPTEGNARPGVLRSFNLFYYMGYVWTTRIPQLYLSATHIFLLYLKGHHWLYLSAQFHT